MERSLRTKNVLFSYSMSNKAYQVQELVDVKNGQEMWNVVCFFEFDKEGPYMKTVGSRFIESKHSKEIVLVSYYATKFLQEAFDEGLCFDH